MERQGKYPCLLLLGGKNMETALQNSYSVIPSEEQVEAIRSYFKMLADRQCKVLKREYGLIEFVQKDLLREPIIARVINSQSYLSSMMTYLQGEGHIARIRRSSPAAPALWNVAKFINDGASVVTKEDLGMITRKRGGKDFPDVEIEVVSKEDKPVQTKAEPQVEQTVTATTEAPVDNASVLMDLNENVSDMIGHIEQLPIAFNAIVRDLTSQLQMINPGIIENFKKEKEELEYKILELEVQLDEAIERLSDANQTINDLKTNVQPEYNKEYIETQCDGINNKLKDILDTPWKINKHKQSYKEAINQRLVNIKRNLGMVE